MKTSSVTLGICTGVFLTFFNLCNAQTVYAFAGSGNGGFGGDGATAVSALFQTPSAVAVDPSGNVYIADSYNARIRKINTAGTISTFAGTGTSGFSGDGGPATLAQLNMPYWISLDPSGNVYVSDFFNSRIRKINSSGVISTIAGTGAGGFSGDGGAAINAQINCPAGMAIDAAGNLYFADGCNQRVRKINQAGVISTVAGTGTFGYSGDGGPATSAQLYSPAGIALDASGNLYISESMNRRIRKITPGGTISTIAGTGGLGTSGNNGAATSANLSPAGMVFDSSGNLYIADPTNHNIRKIDPSGIITTYAGTGIAGLAGDGGPAISAQFKGPGDIAIDLTGIFYIADTGNNRIRKICSSNCLSTGLTSITETAQSEPVFPNPNNGRFTVHYEAAGKDVEFIVTNVFGQKIHTQKISETTSVIQIEGITTGLYNYVLMQENQTLAKGRISVE
jgi:trimeric autotransporter adhesin